MSTFNDLATTTVDGVKYVSASDLTSVIRGSVGKAALLALLDGQYVERTAGMVALAEGIEDVLAKA
jgi:hypothetical protein